MNKAETHQFIEANKEEISKCALEKGIMKASKQLGVNSHAVCAALWETGHKDKVFPSWRKRKESGRIGACKPVVARSTKLDVFPLKDIEKTMGAIITVYEFARKAEALEEENNRLKNIVAAQKEEISRIRVEMDRRSAMALRAQAIARNALVISGD